VPAEEVAEWRERTRSFLLNHEARFDLEWRKFFYNEFSQDAARFDFTLEGARSFNETEIVNAVDVSPFFGLVTGTASTEGVEGPQAPVRFARFRFLTKIGRGREQKGRPDQVADRQEMEAAGVEPASESTSSWDSTCVSASGFSCPA
jgi:hypothetical protein